MRKVLSAQIRKIHFDLHCLKMIGVFIKTPIVIVDTIMIIVMCIVSGESKKLEGKMLTQ